MSDITAGIDVGGTKTRTVTVDSNGSVLSDRRAQSSSGSQALLDQLEALVTTVAAEGAEAVGVGVAGMVRFDGTLTYSPNLAGVEDVPIGPWLVRRSPVPVVVDNDANLAALAEARLGAAKGASQVLMVTLGTGIGGGWVVDGRVQRGAHGYLGEVGHFSAAAGGPICACGARGHWEAYASGEALGRMVSALVESGRGASLVEAAGDEPPRAHHLKAALEAGDLDAIELLDHYADHVAVGLAALVNLLDPEVVVIGGGVVEVGDRLVEAVRRLVVGHLEGSTLRSPVPIRAAALGERANAIGAALAARDLKVGGPR